MDTVLLGGKVTADRDEQGVNLWYDGSFQIALTPAMLQQLANWAVAQKVIPPTIQTIGSGAIGLKLG